MTYISGGTLEGVLRLQSPVTTPALSIAGEGRIYFDGTQFQASQNGAAYTPVVGGGGGGGWTDDGTVVRLTTVGDGVGIGTASPAAGSKLEVLGDATRLNILATGGNPGGAGTGGAITLTGGTGGTTGTGGDTTVRGGAGGSTSGNAGGVLVTGGTPVNGDGGQVQVRGSNGVGTDRSAGGILLYSGDATGNGNAGVLQLEVGTTVGGDPGGVFVITPANSPFDVNVGGNVRFETLNGGTTDFVLDGGTLTVGSTNLVVQDGGTIDLTSGNNAPINITSPASTGSVVVTAAGITLNGTVHNLNAQNPQLTTPDNTAAYVLRPAGSYWTSSGSLIAMPALYYDPQSGQTVTRFGNSVVIDGDGTNNTVSGLDATAQTRQALLENVPGATQDLADYTLTGTPLVPGTVTIRVILSGQSTFSTVTDDGAGNFPVSSVLAAGGTVDYSTGAMTGVTQLLQAGGDLAAYYVTDNTAGEHLTPRGGNGQGTGVGGELRLRGGAGGATAAGGAVTLTGGAGGSTSGAAGAVMIAGGTPVDGNGGSVSLTGSAGVGTNRNGGSVTIQAGAATGSGTAGSVLFNTNGATERARITPTGRLGVGTTAPVATFDTDGSVSAGDVTSVSTNTTLDLTHSVVLVDATGGVVTITLPAVASNGRLRYTIKKIDSSGNAVTIDANGAETIDGATTQTLAAQYDSMEIVTNGTEWFII